MKKAMEESMSLKGILDPTGEIFVLIQNQRQKSFVEEFANFLFRVW